MLQAIRLVDEIVRKWRIWAAALKWKLADWQISVTWELKLSGESKVTPRILLVEKNPMSEPAADKEVRDSLTLLSF